MGMFDNITCVNLALDGFAHNGLAMQTKDLDCLLDGYAIVDRELRLISRDGETLMPSELRPYTGELTLYGDYRVPGGRKWAEYTLRLEDGRVTGVLAANVEDLPKRWPNE